MAWIKQNLIFVIGVVVAVALLGAAGFYDFESWSRNQKALAKLTEVYNKLSDLSKQKPSPGNSQTDNVAAAREQERQLREWANQTTNYFRPIAPIPKPDKGPIPDQLFANALHRTITQLQHEAAAANVALPPDYAFSFAAHVAGTGTAGDRLTFAPGSLEPLSVQLGEVKTISEVLFGAGINALEGIQRNRVSTDDSAGPLTDYLDELPVTNSLAVMVPYEVTFRGFSQEIARVLEAFAASPNGFIVKTVGVQPAGASTLAAPDAAYNPQGLPMTDRARYGYDAGGQLQATAPAAAKGGLQTVLKEQLLRVTLLVEVVKLAPRN